VAVEHVHDAEVVFHRHAADCRFCRQAQVEARVGGEALVAGTVQVVVQPREMPATTPTPTPTSTPTAVQTPTATSTAAPTTGPAGAPPEDDETGTAVAVGASVVLLALATVLAIVRYRE